MTSPPKRPPWRKVLYANREYPDNYTDPSFLKELKTNVNVRLYTYREAICGVTILNNQISCITIFLIVFNLMYSKSVEPGVILLPSCLLSGIGYIWYRGRSTTNITLLLEDSKTLVTVLLFGYLFSPLLHTLTDAISTDTIFTMTCFVLLMNLVFFDYGLDVAMVSKPISLNAAIFGSICLASRLATSFHAFVLLVEAAIFFVLYPILSASVWCAWFMLPIFTVCCTALWFLSPTVLAIYVTIIVFINFVFTGFFVHLQKYKFNIHGPWDEAIVEENTDDNLDEKL